MIAPIVVPVAIATWATESRFASHPFPFHFGRAFFFQDSNFPFSKQSRSHGAFLPGP